MKKIRQLFLLFSLLLCAVGARAQSELTVYEGEATSQYVPIYGFYCDAYQKCEFVMSADNLGDMTGGTISSMTFYLSSPATDSWGNANFQVFLKEVYDTSISAYSGPDDATVVYEGSLDGTQTTLKIEFTTPYQYNGGNLLIGIYNTVQGAYKSSSFYGSTVSGACVQGHDYSSLNGVPANQRNFIPKTTFGYTPAGGVVCAQPTDLVVDNITASSATVSWASDAELWTLQYKSSTAAAWTEVTGIDRPTYSLTNLEQNTTYQVRVKTVCDKDNESLWTTTTFTTLFAMPYLEPFDNTSLPVGWKRYSGLLSDVLAGNANLNLSSSGWYFGTRSAVFDSHAYFNIYGTSAQYWLVTPAVVLDGDAELSFDLALSAYSGNAQPAQTTGTDDKFVVLITTDGGNTWTVLRQWDNVGSQYVYNNISTTGQNFNIDLYDYSGQTVAVAFYGESTSGNADNYIHLDNVSIDSHASCPRPTELAVSNITPTTADLSWVTFVDKWQIGFFDGDEVTGTINVSALEEFDPYTITGLTPETTYKVAVRTICDNEVDEISYSDWTLPITFTTLVACEKPTNVAVANIETRSAVISWEGTSDSYLVLYQVDGATEWEIQTVDEETVTLSGLNPDTSYNFIVKGDCGEFQSQSVFGTFTTLETCVTPTDLAVAVTPTSATVSWEGTSDGYNLRYRTSVVQFFEDFENGIPDVWTTIDNDGDGNNWYIYYPSESGYDPIDGSGNPRVFDQKCATSASYISTGALTPDNWLITPKLDLQGTMSVWLRGQDPDYAEENFAIYLSLAGNSVDDFLSGTTGVELVPETTTTGEYQEYTADLSAYAGQQGYIAIRHFDVTNQFRLNVDNFALLCEETSQEWITIEGIEGTEYELIGLEPGTRYEVQVQGDCGDEQSKWSPVSSFTTLDACPVPFDVTVEPEVTSADVAWEGYSDSYNVRYRTTGTATATVFAENWDGEIGGWYISNLSDQSGLYGGYGVDNSKCFAFVYGSNPPQYLVSPELDGVTDDMKLEFYYKANGGETYPETFQVGYGSTITNISDFTFGNEITVEDSEWHLFSETIPAGTTYFCVKYNSDDQFALFVDDFVVASEEETPVGEWITIEGIEDTEYELTGLEPDTKYELQVRGVCDESETDWSEMVPFTTLYASLVLLNDDFDEEVKNSDKLTETLGKKVNVTLEGRTFFKDGNWNSLYLPFSVTEDMIADENHPLHGSTIKSLYGGSVTGTHVDITFSSASSIEAGYWYIFKWDEVGEDIVEPVFKNVEIEDAEPYYAASADNGQFTVYGNYDTFPIDPSVDGCYTYYLTSNGQMKYSDKYRLLKTFRIFFRFIADNDDAGALEFNLVFDDGSTQTGIVELDGNGRDNHAPEGYYNLQGVKYNGKPIQKGVYINNGRKVVVK